MANFETEQHLTKQDYAFRFAKDFLLSQIDMKEAMANPARLGKKLDQERALLYGQDMLDGYIFPAIVVFDHGDDEMFQLVTGVHRIAGADVALIKTLDAFVVREPDPYRRDLLIRTINNIEGDTPDRAERLKQAVETHRLYPEISIPELARRHGIAKEKTLAVHLRAVKAEQRAERLGVAFWFTNSRRGFSLDVRIAANSVLNDVLFKRVVQIIGRHAVDMPAEAAISFIKQIKATTTEAQGLEICDKREVELIKLEELRKKGNGRAPTAASTKMVGLLKGIVSLWKTNNGNIGFETLKQPTNFIPLIEEAGAILLDDLLPEVMELLKQMKRADEWKRERPTDGARPSAPT
jgi:hypothetical protein